MGVSTQTTAILCFCTYTDELYLYNDVFNEARMSFDAYISPPIPYIRDYVIPATKQVEQVLLCNAYISSTYLHTYIRTYLHIQHAHRSFTFTVCVLNCKRFLVPGFLCDLLLSKEYYVTMWLCLLSKIPICFLLTPVIVFIVVVIYSTFVIQ